MGSASIHGRWRQGSGGWDGDGKRREIAVGTRESTVAVLWVWREEWRGYSKGGGRESGEGGEESGGPRWWRGGSAAGVENGV